MKIELNIIHNESCLTGLPKLPDKSVNCCVTSPPYFGLRDYGTAEQIGLEQTPDEFVAKLVQVFTEVHRVLKDDGTLWLNLGDSYSSGGRKERDTDPKLPQRNNGFRPNDGLKPKDLIGIPWMVAFALRSAGWYLRQDIIWHKPNPMPESVTDRCTKAHEYIFLLSKSQRYYYDHKAIMQDAKGSSIQRLSQDVENQAGSSRVPGKTNGTMKARASWNGSTFDKGKTGEMMETRGGIVKSGNKERKPASARGIPDDSDTGLCGSLPWEGAKANKRSVWTVTTKPFKEAHFATFPPDLIEPCILAGCPEGGVVLDPFMGAGTTALVSRSLDRNYIGFELNEEYIQIAESRLKRNLGMFN